MIKKLLLQFKTEKSDHKLVILEVLFDFAIVALVSLIFSGFIIKNKVAPIDQFVFMIGNTALLSTHWYAHIFFKQRYAKRNNFHRVWISLKILGLLTMAIGIDLMVFRKNQLQSDAEFLRWFSLALFLIGFIFSRFITFLSFLFAALANRKDIAIYKMSIFKSISRFTTMTLAIVQLSLVFIFKNNIVPLSTYIFIPIYVVIELVGNIININDKNLKSAPKISIAYAKERYSKLNLLYIASFFTAGTIQFAYYFHNSSDLHMLASLFTVWFIGLMIWWSFIDRVYKFNIESNAKSLVKFSLINIIMSIGIILMGAMLINSHSSSIHKFMPPIIFFGFIIYIIAYWWSASIFIKCSKKSNFNKKLFFNFSLHYLIVILIALTIGILEIFISIPMYVNYIILTSLFLSLNIVSSILKKRNRLDLD